MRRRSFAEYSFVALAGLFLATAAAQFNTLWEEPFPRMLATGCSVLASLVACFACFYMATVSSRAELHETSPSPPKGSDPRPTLHVVDRD